MKNNIVFKFLALMLCAAMLLTAAAGILGIFAMNEAGLYQRSADEAYSDYLTRSLEDYAYYLAQRAASQEVGGLTPEMADAYYADRYYYGGAFNHVRMGYTVRDENGSALVTDTLYQDYPVVNTVTIPVTGQYYISAVSTMPLSEPASPEMPAVLDEDGVYDAVPFEGAQVHSLTVGYPDSSEGVSSEDAIGMIYHDSEGHVTFNAHQDGLVDLSNRGSLTYICFENRDTGVLYEASSPDGVGLLYSDTSGFMKFQSNEVNPAFAPAATEPLEILREVPGEEVEYNGYSSGANVYSAPSEESDVVATVPEEMEVSIIDSYTVDGKLWYLTELGWILAEPVAVQEAGATPRQEIDVYSVPNLDGAPVGKLHPDAAYEIIRAVNVEGKEWLLLPEGWVLAEALNAGPEAEPLPQETAAATTPEETAPAVTIETVVPTEETASAPEETAVPEETATSVEETAVAEETAPSVEETVYPPEETVVPEVSAAAYHADAEAEAEAAAVAFYDNLQYLDYYDQELGQQMTLEYTQLEMPEYTVEFTLAANALRYEYEWVLLRLVYQLRNVLFPVVGISLLLFAVLAVYLCCAAGRKPGTNVVRAEGLNRLPIDGYFVLVCCGVTVAVLAGVEGTRYLLDGSTQVAIAFAAIVSYCACLLVVGFCYALAAQVKTPGGFWWKHSLCGLSLRGLKVCWRWFGAAMRWVARQLEVRVIPLTRRLLRAGWKFGCVMASLAWRVICRGMELVKKLCQRLTAVFLRFWQLLPMTWQWLLTGFFIIFLLAVTVNSPGFAFWGICGTIAIVLYGTQAFGTLLEGVKHMNKGDLDNKVEEKILIGSFREFAEELNGLADVAVVAAQKQLKSERMKTELITNVSHDIKTPLTSIINYIDLMKLPHSDEEQEQYLEVLSRQSQRLKKLIDDLMELSKASTGNMQVEICAVDAVEAVNQALGEFSDKLERSDLQPVFRQSGERFLMMADGRLVWRVLSNLLSNAVKYAQSGTRLYIDVAEVEGKVIISMKNISRQELNVSADELLERFVRGDVSRNTEGSGLGLNIAQSLMELQKGALQLLVDGDLFKVTLIFPGA